MAFFFLKKKNKNMMFLFLPNKKSTMSHYKLKVYSCKECYLEFYYENHITHCPFCGNKVEYVGSIQENEIEEPIYVLKYSTGEKMQKKIEEEEAIKEAEESWYLWEE